MKGGGLILILGAGGLAYWYFSKHPLTTTTPPPGAIPPTPIVTPPVVTPPASVTLASIQAALASSGGANSMLSADQWCFYFNQLHPNGLQCPDPVATFGQGNPNWDRTQAMSLTQWWAVMGPWLTANAGLSGLGERRLWAV